MSLLNRLKTPIISTFSQKDLVLRIFLLVSFIFITNTLAMYFFWYSSLWWFDMPMHYLGGLFLGFFVLGLVLYTPLGKREKKTTSYDYILFLLAGVIAIGLLWEMFEYVVDLNTTQIGFNLSDTLSDIMFDTAGGLTFILYYLSLHTKKVE